jgi:hypothetical protein
MEIDKKLWKILVGQIYKIRRGCIVHSRKKERGRELIGVARDSDRCRDVLITVMNIK